MEKTILIIDDDALVTHSLSNFLTKEGYSATTSQNGYEALDKILKERDFDLIICDIRLPGMNGVEIVKTIKEHLKNMGKPEVPVIFITGYADEDLNKQAENLGKLFLKPFDSEELLEAVKQYIEIKRNNN